MITADDQLSFLGRTNFRDTRKLFGVKRRDRCHHLYMVGKTGTGKSTLLGNLIRQDLVRGEGLALLDPHGDLVSAVRDRFPEERRDDLVLWRVADRSSVIRFNPLEQVPPEKRPVAAAGLLEVFKKLWADSWGPRLEHILRNALFALLDQPEATLADIPRLLTDSAYRRRAAGRVLNAQVREFWLREYEGYTARLRSEAIVPVQNKVGAFLADPVLRTILTAPRSTLNLREMMDGGKVLLGLSTWPGRPARGAAPSLLPLPRRVPDLCDLESRRDALRAAEVSGGIGARTPVPRAASSGTWGRL